MPDLTKQDIRTVHELENAMADVALRDVALRDLPPVAASPIAAAISASADATVEAAEADITGALRELRKLAPKTFAALLERLKLERDALASGSSPPAADGAVQRAYTADQLGILRERVGDAWAASRLLSRLLEAGDFDHADLRAAGRVAAELTLELEDLEGHLADVSESEED